MSERAAHQTIKKQQNIAYISVGWGISYSDGFIGRQRKTSFEYFYNFFLLFFFWNSIATATMNCIKINLPKINVKIEDFAFHYNCNIIKLSFSRNEKNSENLFFFSLFILRWFFFLLMKGNSDSLDIIEYLPLDESLHLDPWICQEIWRRFSFGLQKRNW